jgi:hypothetical protein
LGLFVILIQPSTTQLFAVPVAVRVNIGWDNVSPPIKLLLVSKVFVPGRRVYVLEGGLCCVQAPTMVSLPVILVLLAIVVAPVILVAPVMVVRPENAILSFAVSPLDINIDPLALLIEYTSPKKKPSSL